MIPRPVLFLDFDGVLGAGRVWAQNESRRWTCPAGWLDPVLIARFNRLVRRTGAAVVLSTSWRTWLDPRATWPALRALLVPYVGPLDVRRVASAVYARAHNAPWLLGPCDDDARR